ncbi:hypothetical protein W59_33078 [Rhodococcus opacus RKJ300 = JCM 13270]|uniref:Uncharacterized protein n=1 Tax=Rhodococcus opacus RKJ300 = JCM 13270 TaxID=1165867 RepID=I0WAY2_RHOOP|nr:hypothetical protein W59_33078 [Rhodococcus opacus RKJ300 = JCM 13270]
MTNQFVFETNQFVSPTTRFGAMSSQFLPVESQIVIVASKIEFVILQRSVHLSVERIERGETTALGIRQLFRTGAAYLRTLQ